MKIYIILNAGTVLAGASVDRKAFVEKGDALVEARRQIMDVYKWDKEKPSIADLQDFDEELADNIIIRYVSEDSETAIEVIEVEIAS